VQDDTEPDDTEPDDTEPDDTEPDDTDDLDPRPEASDESLAQRAADQWPLGLVLLGVVGGLAVIAVGGFRAGSVMVAAALVFAAFLRAFLPEEVVGMLAIRRRSTDVVTMAMFGLALAVVAFLVPPA
jgi:hypothetical protein